MNYISVKNLPQKINYIVVHIVRHKVSWKLMAFVWWCTLKIIGMLVHLFYFMDILEEKKHIYIYIYIYWFSNLYKYIYKTYHRKSKGLFQFQLKTRTCLKHFKNELYFCKEFASEDKLYCGTYFYNSCNTFSRQQLGSGSIYL
jgi:hypothetical protein